MEKDLQNRTAYLGPKHILLFTAQVAKCCFVMKVTCIKDIEEPGQYVVADHSTKQPTVDH